MAWHGMAWHGMAWHGMQPGGHVLVRDYAAGDLAQVGGSNLFLTCVSQVCFSGVFLSVWVRCHAWEQVSNPMIVVTACCPAAAHPFSATVYPLPSRLPTTLPCAQERLRRKEQRIADNFYVRGDGTRAYYFTEAALGELFEGAGMQCVHMGVCERTVTNRARQIDMHSLINPINPLPVYARPQDHALSLSHLPLRVRLLSREHQHTHGSTGRLLWESSQVLAALLLAHPALTRHASLLELGAGGAALCSLAATHSAPRVIVATDGDESALSLLPGNLELNAGSFETSRIKVCRLRWGNEGDEAAVRQLLPSDDVVGAEQGRVQEEGGGSTTGSEGSTAHIPATAGCSVKEGDAGAACTEAQQGRGFDVILGADVVYVRAAVPLLFQSASRLLARRDGSGRVPVLLLCHITHQVSEPDVLAAAAAAGLELAEGEVAELVGGSVERAMQAAVGTVFPGESRDASLFRLLCFRASRSS
ncbi:unnamed protein product [Closterium sp. Yama58-4]|nr:unnamed protein product [Closterium sp. Yama58-4]